MRNGKEKPTTKRKDNSIGTSVNKKAREIAKKILPKAKKVERDRRDKGYVWVRKGKTKKQVNPEKLNFYLDDGWKRI